jgi:hypothetical protein
MCSRTFSALVWAVLLAGCGAAPSPPPPGEAVECAIGAGAEFAAACTLETLPGAKGIVLHHPDGGFRRLARDRASGTLAPQDGAEPLVLQDGGNDVVHFAIGADRYRIPAARLAPASP